MRFLAIMDREKPKKIFHLQLSRPHRKHYGCISNCVASDCAGILNSPKAVEAFQAALGYTKETAKASGLFDEYIFDEYIRFEAPQSPEVLQARIAEHLSEHCPRFPDNLSE